MNEVSKFERAINELRDAVPPPSPKKKRRPDDVNHSVMRKELPARGLAGVDMGCVLPSFGLNDHSAFNSGPVPFLILF
ncbi:hypothetical protein EVAR_21514_1 [Eumeta japonica]|uniref:Uncharacterized protein n=1 Tax=Eumeta variegata TaxID=151549 RepID=A0A4C1UZL1_EUMVA|nr:hypothetical protein EVAR_21514_1 [Eumeta japonica]